jgi:predicted oxidoreductase
MIWSALAGGQLFSSSDQRAMRLRAVLDGIAARHGVSAATVATAWALQHPSRPVVLTGSSRLQAIQDAVAATRLELTRDEWFSLWTASSGHALP